MLYVMLAGAYPFERPEDKGDPQKLQRMIQRILRVEYALPAALRPSAPLADLLARLLVADPAQVRGGCGCLGVGWLGGWAWGFWGWVIGRGVPGLGVRVQNARTLCALWTLNPSQN